MNHKKIIGILAGMGPRSTAPFVDQVITECQKQYGAQYDDEFPHMMIYSLPTPFYVDRPIDHAKMQETVKEGLLKLEQTGVDFIAMPCNTVHAYYDELKKSISVPLLNIVHEITSKISKTNKTALIATRATVESNVYQKEFLVHEIQCIWNEEIQSCVDQCLLEIKSGSGCHENSWNQLVSALFVQNCDSIVVACTDLSNLPWSLLGLEYVDSSKCLAEAVVRRYLG